MNVRKDGASPWGVHVSWQVVLRRLQELDFRAQEAEIGQRQVGI
jgi:hypothetical protein